MKALRLIYRTIKVFPWIGPLVIDLRNFVLPASKLSNFHSIHISSTVLNHLPEMSSLILPTEDFLLSPEKWADQQQIILVSLSNAYSQPEIDEILSMYSPKVSHHVCGSRAALDAFFRIFLKNADVIAIQDKMDDSR